MPVTRRRDDDFEIVWPDGGGAVIIRIRKPWPVPRPVLDVQAEDDHGEEGMAALRYVKLRETRPDPLWSAPGRV